MWNEAQKWESDWWGDCISTEFGEEVKQIEYAKLMGLEFFHDGKSSFNIDCHNKSIVDIGGGPCSLLLKTRNASRKVVVEPMDLPSWVKERYKAAGIEVIQQKGEDLQLEGFDEAWIYNVLQHTEDPEKIIKNAKRAAKIVRVFEWIDTPINQGHPQALTKKKLDEWLEIDGNTQILSDKEKNLIGCCYYGIYTRPTPSIIKLHPDHYRFHYLGLVHLPVARRYGLCAFSEKIWKLSKMLTDLGHEVYVYGCEGGDAQCTEYIVTHSLKDVVEEWGDKPPNPNFEIGYDYTKEQFRHDMNAPMTKTRAKFNANATKEINARKRDDDFLLLSMGVYQKPVADAVNLFLTCEPGIGYRGSFCRFRAFESAYIQNFTYGSEHPRESINGDYYSRVIPNYFLEEDFPFSSQPKDYFAYVGRMILRKGVWTAVKATEEIGAKLILAGQPDPEIDISKLPNHCEYIGVVDQEERAKLLGGAIATFVPTIYLEPFASVHAESMAVGTPVITTSFGVFGGDTFVDGVHGFKCNTLDDFVFAAKNAHKLDRYEVRKQGEKFFTKNVQWQFQRWFDDLYQLYLSAKYPGMKGWSHIRDSEPSWREHIYKQI